MVIGSKKVFLRIIFYYKIYHTSWNKTQIISFQIKPFNLFVKNSCNFLQDISSPAAKQPWELHTKSLLSKLYYTFIINLIDLIIMISMNMSSI